MTKRRYLLSVIGILSLTCLSYTGIYQADFVYEDGNATGFASPTPMEISPLRVRAVTRISYRIDRWVSDRFGGHARAYHLTNLGLHLLNGVMVARLALGWISPVGSLIAMGIFLLHPLQTEAVSYIAGRTEVLSTAFVLFACVLSVGPGKLFRSIWSWIGIAGLLLLAMSAKESAICGVGLVGLALVYEYGIEYPYDLIRRYWLLLLLLFFACLGLAASVYWYEYKPIGHSPLGRIHYAALQATALWRYLFMIPYPWGQTVDHDFEILPLWLQGVALVGLILTYCTGWFIAMILERDREFPRLLLFCGNWILIAIILRFLIRIPETINEHQIYLLWVGVSLGIATVVERYSGSLFHTWFVLDPSSAGGCGLDFVNNHPCLDW